MDIRIADRMASFQSGVFAELALLKSEYQNAGKEVLDFSIGSPNTSPPLQTRRVLSESALKGSEYIYSLRDLSSLRAAAAYWYRSRYNVNLDASNEIVSLYGSQDGLAHFCLAFINPGDTVLVPNPYFPTFMSGPRLAGAKIEFMPLLKKNAYLIDFDKIPAETAKAAKLIIVSYPNNPTTAIADDQFYSKLISFAKAYDIIVLHDNAYSDLVFDGGHGKSFLSYDGAKDIGIELNSLSKSYGMAGARMGFCLGNKEICKTLELLKSNIDLGSFLAVQYAAVEALTGDQSVVKENCLEYEKRRDLLYNGLCSIGWEVSSPKGTIFLWAPLPKKYRNSKAFVLYLLEQTGILLAPGSAFGSYGEGYVRFSLFADELKITKAIERLDQSGIIK